MFSSTKTIYPSTINYQPSTINHQPSTFHTQSLHTQSHLIPPVDMNLVRAPGTSFIAIVKILDDARLELQLRRARVSAENKRFASDMKRKVDSALAERRQESKASALKGVARSLSDVALIATTDKPIDTDTTTAADKPMTTPLSLFSA